jgi:TfoX/Sxy family transcriptional regulator of competence genes
MAYNEELAERMRKILKTGSMGIEKKMFGGTGFMINGNLACGVNKQDLILRLGESEFEKAMKQPHVRIFDMTGRPMKGWILISSDGYKSDKALRNWIEKGINFAKSLPPK